MYVLAILLVIKLTNVYNRQLTDNVTTLYLEVPRVNKMTTLPSATTKADSGEAKTKPAGCASSSTDADPAFTIGSSVLVGGVKPGRLRYIGGVHFVAGHWCGVELDDADGLHDGVVDGVRYFTCRDGHGIFAPRHRVLLRTRGRSSALPASPDVRLRTLRKPTTNVPAAGVEDGDVDRLNDVRVSSPRHRHQASLDGRDLDFSSALKSGSGRAQSAILTEDDEPSATTDSSRKRSSLVTGRLVPSNTPKSSPKRVTFFDEIINSKERGIPSIITDVAGTDRRQRGQADVDDDDYQVVTSEVRNDNRTSVTLALDLDEGSPSRKTLRTDANRAYVDSDLDSRRLDLDVGNMLTTNEELSLSSDSIEANEIDNDFAAYGLASVAKKSGSAQNETSQAAASKSPKTRIDAALSDLEFMAGHRRNRSLDFNNESQNSGLVYVKGDGGAQSATSSAARASFELARTALTQYADLVRAAQESTAVRRSWTPPAVRRSLPTPTTTSSTAPHRRAAFEYEPSAAPEKDRGSDGRLERSPEPAALDGGSGSGSADEVDFETFDGEELDSIGDAMIDSIDGSSVQSEDSIAMLPHLSDVDDDDDVVDVKGDRVLRVVFETATSDQLTSTSRDHDNGNVVELKLNERTASGENNSNNDVDNVNLLNELNDAVTCRQQLALTDSLPMCAEISNVDRTGGQCLVVGIVDSNHAAQTMTTTIANDIDCFLRQSTAIRDERPMSLISSSSSTDTGE